MSNSLKHVLLTRPMGRNSTMAEQLAARGIASVELPMMQIAINDDDAEAQEIKQQLTGVILPEMDVVYKLDSTFDYAFFISANAVDAAASFCERYGVAWQPELPCLGMGTATAAAIRKQGWRVFHTDQQTGEQESFTSEEILQKSWLTQVQGKRILLVKGALGRGVLADTLRQRGAAVEPVSVYRREAPVYSAAALSEQLAEFVASPESAAAIFASGETLQNFYDQVAEKPEQVLLTQLRCLVPSMRVALQAQELGFTKVVVANGATDNAFLPHLLALAD